VGIDVVETGIRVLDLYVPGRDLADYLRHIPNDEREGALVELIDVGLHCLQRAKGGRDVEFVKRATRELLTEVEGAVARIPLETQRQLAAKIGVGDGQVLAPVHAMVNEASRAMTERVRDVRELLSNDLDPTRESSTLGKVLRELRELVNPNRTDSIPAAFESAIHRATAENGTLATSVKAVVTEAMKPLADQVDRLGRDIRGREAAHEALEETTAKGAAYEDQVVSAAQAWARCCGAEVRHVGSDRRPGDILITLPPRSTDGVNMSIVVEAKDEALPAGRRAISDAMARAMAERGANAGIYLSRSIDGLGNEIADWAEGECQDGPWVATTHELLCIAIRFLLVLRRLASLRASRPDLDAVAIEAQIRRIRTALGHVANINRKVTEVKGIAGDIQREAEALREEVRAALVAAEDAVRIVSGDDQGSDAA
jgi:hypothetical protein